MTLDDTMKHITETLRDAIWDTPSDCLEDAPADVYADLAARFVLKLAKQNLTIVPTVSSAVARKHEIARSRGESAARIFDIFTTWMSGRMDRSLRANLSSTGRFEIMMQETGKVRALFQGDSVQDAFAQTAQTISFNGGSFDGEETHTQTD